MLFSKKTMPNSSKETIIWLDHSPVFSPEISRLAQDNGYKLQICAGVAEFLQAAEEHKENPQSVAGFILKAFMFLDKKDKTVFRERLPRVPEDWWRYSSNAVRWLVVEYLRKNAQSSFSRTPLLIHEATRESKREIYDIGGRNPHLIQDINYISKRFVEEMPDYLQELEDWFSSLKAA